MQSSAFSIFPKFRFSFFPDRWPSAAQPDPSSLLPFSVPPSPLPSCPSPAHSQLSVSNHFHSSAFSIFRKLCIFHFFQTAGPAQPSRTLRTFHRPSVPPSIEPRLLISRIWGTVSIFPEFRLFYSSTVPHLIFFQTSMRSFKHDPPQAERRALGARRACNQKSRNLCRKSLEKEEHENAVKRWLPKMYGTRK